MVLRYGSMFIRLVYLGKIWPILMTLICLWYLYRAGCRLEWRHVEIKISKWFTDLLFNNLHLLGIRMNDDTFFEIERELIWIVCSFAESVPIIFSIFKRRKMINIFFAKCSGQVMRSAITFWTWNFEGCIWIELPSDEPTVLSRGRNRLRALEFVTACRALYLKSKNLFLKYY